MKFEIKASFHTSITAHKAVKTEINACHLITEVGAESTG
jgi:hypothetical protein